MEATVFGILLLSIVFVWLLVGGAWKFSSKFLAATLILMGYIMFLHLNGLTRQEILEIIFSF